MTLTAEQIMTFVKAHAIPDDQARSMAALAKDPQYWTSLCAGLSIGADRMRTSLDVGERPDHAELFDEYARSGYCCCAAAFSSEDLSRLSTAVSKVHQAGWPMVFAFVFDEFWNILQAPKLTAFLTDLLGSRYQTTARFLVNFVPPTIGASGFPPHLDGGQDHTVTCWVPLTFASPDNGCIYVVERTPASATVLSEFRSADTFTKQQLLLLLAHARALPAAPGSFLAWRQDTIHWGGLYRTGLPRLALSWEFMGAHHPNLDSALRLALATDLPLPTLGSRLRWVCHSLSKTTGRDMSAARFGPLIREILS